MVSNAQGVMERTGEKGYREKKTGLFMTKYSKKILPTDCSTRPSSRKRQINQKFGTICHTEVCLIFLR
jgi:hypothetical protein